MRTEFWSSDTSPTALQVRDDTDPMVWLNTNFGWVPISNAPKDYLLAVAWCGGYAARNNLIHRDEETALMMAGY